LTEIRQYSTIQLIREDWKANPGNSRIRLSLFLFRLASRTTRMGKVGRLITVPARLMYQVLVAWLFSIDIPPGTKIGPGLRVLHGFGLVIHSKAIIGPNCVLRHGVTVGVRRTGEVPAQTPVLGANVDVGSGAQILGAVRVGNGASIGAGAIVLSDVPAGLIAVGNPARLLPSKLSI
jgi:serine acetyltransferase